MSDNAVRQDYELTPAEGFVNLVVPFARLADATPKAGNPCALLSDTAGKQLVGVVLTTDDARSLATCQFPGAIGYKAQVRNVKTYSAGAEATFQSEGIGDEVYYDRSATMPAGVSLSTSPLDSTGAANPFYGYVVPVDDETDLPLYPKGTTSASTQTVGVLCVNAN